MGGITQSVDRMELVDFTSPLGSDPHETLYSVHESDEIIVGFIATPFSLAVWLSVFVVITFLTLIGNVVYKMFWDKYKMVSFLLVSEHLGNAFSKFMFFFYV